MQTIKTKPSENTLGINEKKIEDIKWKDKSNW